MRRARSARSPARLRRACSGATRSRRGSRASTRTVTLWDNLRLYARVDGNGGNWQSDTEIRALHNQGSTKAVILQNDPFLQTYRAIEADAPSTYQRGLPAAARALGVVHAASRRSLQRIGASGGSITLAGRNLSMLWTAEQGWNTSRDGEIYVDVANQHVWDPEIRALGSLSNGFQTIMPPTASFVATLPPHLLIPDRGTIESCHSDLLIGRRRSLRCGRPSTRRDARHSRSRSSASARATACSTSTIPAACRPNRLSDPALAPALAAAAMQTLAVRRRCSTPPPPAC